MSDDVEQKLKVFFASAPQLERRIEVLEIGHSAMTKTYWCAREPYPFQVTDETAVVRDVTPLNFEAKRAGTTAHLDQIYEIALDTTDITDEFRENMKLVPLYSTEPVRVVLREYLSDDLTDVLSRAVLRLEEVSYKIGAAMLHAVQPRLNMLRTGTSYTPRRVPMMRAFV